MTPIIWSIAGTDSGGGAGLAADQRAADALGVHCCTVVAGITAQSTTEVTHIEATPPHVLQAQLDTLLADMPPRVIKTGLLGSADNVRVLARFIDQQRERFGVELVCKLPAASQICMPAGSPIIPGPPGSPAPDAAPTP